MLDREAEKPVGGPRQPCACGARQARGDGRCLSRWRPSRRQARPWALPFQDALGQYVVAGGNHHLRAKTSAEAPRPESWNAETRASASGPRDQKAQPAHLWSHGSVHRRDQRRPALLWRAVTQADAAADNQSSPEVASQAVQIPAFKWVNTTIGNIKNAIRGTYHAVRPKHVPRYLAQYEYRFNRRYRLEDMIPRLAWVALRTPPMPYRMLKSAEFGA